MTVAKLTALVDLDGTLTDPYLGISASILHALEQLGQPALDEPALRAAIGPPLEGTFAALLDGDAVMAKQALGHYRERFGSVGLFENVLFDGIPEALGSLQAAGVQMFLASSKPRVFCERILDHFELTPFFRTVHGSELDGRLAEKNDLVAHILKVEAIDPDRCVMIGDRRYDIEGARANRIKVAAVGWGYGTVEEFETFPPDAIVPHVAELAPTVLRLLRGEV
jgi:phosphoglycolate phosphatase